MTIDTKSATAVSNLDAAPSIRPGSWVHGGNGNEFVGTVEASGPSSVGSVYRMFRVRSGDRPSSIKYSCDTTSVGTVDIGIYDTAANGGAAVNTSLFASAISTAPALFESQVLKPAGDIANSEKRIWELLGLPQDPFKEYDVAITPVATLGNAGTHTLKGTFAR
jgi:hypothetical protein